MNIRTISVCGAMAAIALLTPSFAHANPLIFNWTFAGPDLSGSGTLTATPDPSLAGVDDILSGSGILTAGSNTFNVNIAPCANFATTCTFTNTDGAGANLQVDNLLWPTNAPGSQLDGYGIAFTPGPPGSGASYIGVWDGPSQYFYQWSQQGYEFLTTPFEVNAMGDAPASTPEPSSLLLLGTGAAVAGVVLRKKLRT